MNPERASLQPFTVAIADDDIEMLSLLGNMADWASLGLEIVARGKDGADVLRQLGDASVDLLLSDITMPGMDGYKLAEALRARNPALQVIFFTCHEDFEHAQQAIRVGAEEYLVKYTLTKKVLEDTLRKAVQDAEARRGSRRRMQAFDHSLLSARESFIYELVRTAREDPIALEEKLALYKMQIPGQSFCLISLCPEGGEAAQEDGMRSWRYEVAELVRESFEASGIEDTLFLYEGQVVILHSWNDPPVFDAAYLSVLRRCIATINETMRQHVIAIRSRTGHRATDIKPAIASIAQRRAAQFYHREPLRMQEEVPQPAYTTLSFEAFEEMLAALKLAFRQRMDFLTTLDSAAETLAAKNVEPATVRRLCEALLSYMHRTGLQVSQAPPSPQLEQASFAACIAAIEDQFTRYNEAFGSAMLQAKHQDVQKAIRYIEANLSGDVSLPTVAREISISTGYLSRLFKHQTGVSFSDFLIQRRIDRATQLLEETNRTMEEIAEGIGIENVSYFFRFYKRETGKTPGSVRREKR